MYYLFGCEFIKLDMLKNQAMYAAKISHVFSTIKPMIGHSKTEDSSYPGVLEKIVFSVRNLIP